MAAESVRSIELRRLDFLRKQAAQYGPMTDPAILIEIRKLETKYKDHAARSRGGQDSDLLDNTVAAVLALIAEDRDERQKRQDAADKRMIERDQKLEALTIKVEAVTSKVDINNVLVTFFGFIGIVALIVAIVVAVKVF